VGHGGAERSHGASRPLRAYAAARAVTRSDAGGSALDAVVAAVRLETIEANAGLGPEPTATAPSRLMRR
jgi:isoaspartyl peptidase/L-asparaginase-like protein (Ntn-hydrolase superfamily)